MDYKYIEQLLERYWDCLTTPEEEHILHTFFRQAGVPQHLERYKPLFECMAEHADALPGKDFDERVLRMAAEMQPEAAAEPRQTPLRRTLRIVLNTAASVAAICILGVAAHQVFNHKKAPIGWDYNPAAYTDTYMSAEDAYDESIEALRMVQECLKETPTDSVGTKGNALAIEKNEP